MNSIKFFILTPLLIMIFVSCSKEKDPPQPKNSSSGGGTSTCNSGYTGTNCTTQITPSAIRVNKVVVTKFTQYDGGSNWDVLDVGDSRPDLYITLSLGPSILLTSNYFQDVNYFQNYTFNSSGKFPFDIVVPTSQFTIRAYDYDSGTDDFMGGVIFTPYYNTNNFPTVITLDAGGSVAFQLHVSYYF